MRKTFTLLACTFSFLSLAGGALAQDTNATAVTSEASAPVVANHDASFQTIAAAVNPDAEGDQKVRFRKALAAMTEVVTADMTAEQAVAKARSQANVSGSKSEKMATMLVEMWNLNVDRMKEPATVAALRQGEMPSPALKRP